MRKIRVAFVKFSGLATGGTERWLQMIAAGLPRDLFAADYFYCDSAPYVGSDYKHADTDPDRLQYMNQRGVNLIKFNVLAKDVTTPTHEWVGTDFWQKFDASRYDFVQTAKAGPAEYPYYMMTIPVVEFVALSAGYDSSPNIAWSFQVSQWQRREWLAAGGNAVKSSVVPVPVLAPSIANNLRNELGIPEGAVVGGLHQRVDDGIFSPIPLEAFAKVSLPDQHFILMGGSELYRAQAASLRLNNVHFLKPSGNADRISAFLNSLDVFVHGRRDGETFGTVLAEAMIHGVPCLSHPSFVGTNNAQRETMGPGGLFASGRAEYAAMLGTLLQDQGLRQKLSAKAMAHAAQYYSLSACVKGVGDTYARLTGASAAATGYSSAPPYECSPRGYLRAANMAERPRTAHAPSLAGDLQEFEIDLARQLFPPIKTVVDIGAGNGPFCLVAAKEMEPGGRVIAYDTRPECLSDLRQAVYLNNWEDRLDVRPIDLAAQSSRVREQSSAPSEGTHGDLAGDRAVPSDAAAADTLDDQFEELHLDGLDLVRISEPYSALRVLRGAEDVMARYSPAMMIGITDSSAGRPLTNMGDLASVRWLQDHGYSVYSCTRDLRVRKVAPTSPPTTPGTYFCFKIGLHKDWEAKIGTWALKYRMWRLFRRSRTGEPTQSLRKPNRLEKALRNPRAAMRSLDAWVRLIYRDPANGGREGDRQTHGRPRERRR